MKQMKTLRKKRMPPLAQSILIFAAVFFLLAILESNQFLSAKNLLSILKFATFPGVLTIGLAFVILSGQIDLSCGMLMGLVSVLLAYFVLADIGVVWAVLLAVGIGTLCGLLNGVLTVCLKLPAFIVTIGTQQIFSGLAYLVFNSPQKVFTNPDLQKIGKISIGGVSVVFLYFVVFLLLAAFVLKYTTYGRKIYAVGANAAASRFAGINVGRIQLSVFAICGFMTSIAAVLSTAVNYAGVANVGETFTTDAISSAVLGGFSLAGGRGNMIGIFFGVLLLRMITNGMNLLGVQTYWQMLIKGLILVLALIVDVLESRKK